MASCPLYIYNFYLFIYFILFVRINRASITFAFKAITGISQDTGTFIVISKESSLKAFIEISTRDNIKGYEPRPQKTSLPDSDQVRRKPV